jgi:hypothetical protein
MFVLRVGAVVVGVLSARVAAAAPADGDVGPVPEAGVAAPRLPGFEVTTARRVRHDWYIGFGIGLGAGNVSPSATGTGTVAGAAMVLQVRGGGRISDKVAIGGLAVTSFGARNGGTRGFANLMVEGLFFPVKGRGLGLGVAVGLSSTYGGRAKQGDVTPPADPARPGVGFGVGLGYDFWLARRFNLGIWARGDGSAGVYGLRATGTLGLAFSWY